MALDHLILVRPLASPSAVELSVVIWVGRVCGWPISSRICRMWAASCPLWNRAPISAMMFFKTAAFHMDGAIGAWIIGWLVGIAQVKVSSYSGSGLRFTQIGGIAVGVQYHVAAVKLYGCVWVGCCII